jgi:signal transduction histidine kinase
MAGEPRMGVRGLLDPLLRSQGVLRRILLAVGLPAGAAVLALSAFAVATSTSSRLLERASEWSEHVSALKDVRLAADAFVERIQDRLHAGGAVSRTPEVGALAGALREAARTSRRLAARFSPEEAEDEERLLQSVDGLAAAGTAALRTGARADLAGAIATYRDEVVPLLEDRVEDEIAGARGALAEARRDAERCFVVAAMVSAALLAGALWASARLARHLVTSISLITSGAQRISAGDLRHRVPLRSPDELGALADVFNDMARALGDNTVTRVELARQVAERTAELERSRALLEEHLSRLKQAQAQLVDSERMAAIGVLAAGVAHEINNPLSFVLANVRFAADAFGRDDAAERAEALLALREANVGAQRVGEIVRSLRGLARAESSGPVDVAKVVDSTLQLAWGSLKNEALLVRDLGPAPAVDLGEGRLGQVVVNLVMNAVHAMPPRDRSRNLIRVTTGTSAAGGAFVEVADNGGGMTAAVRARVFEPFFTTKPSGAGTGLGLSICRHVVESVGGRISCESEPGQGSTFRVELPPAKSRPRAASAAPSPAAPAGEARRARVLVVDDEPLVAAALRRMLSGYDVVTVSSGHEALDRVAGGERFDVLVCDVLMPEMTGPELRDELARRGFDLARRMAFVTGVAGPPGADPSATLAPSPVLAKPFDVAALRAVTARLAAGEDRPASAGARGDAPAAA